MIAKLCILLVLGLLPPVESNDSVLLALSAEAEAQAYAACFADSDWRGECAVGEPEQLPGYCWSNSCGGSCCKNGFWGDCVRCSCCVNKWPRGGLICTHSPWICQAASVPVPDEPVPIGSAWECEPGCVCYVECLDDGLCCDAKDCGGGPEYAWCWAE